MLNFVLSWKKKMLRLLQSLWLGKFCTEAEKRKKDAGLSFDPAAVIAVAEHPTIVVIGDEATAKSTVLCRLVEARVLPSGLGIITRRPLRIELRYDVTKTSGLSTFTLSFPEKENWSVVTEDPNIIREAIIVNQREIKSSGKGLDKRTAVLRIDSANVLNIDLQDLPGLLAVAQADEPSDMAKMAEEIALEHLDRKDIIALHIVEASANARHSPTRALVQKLSLRRIIQVVTKCDKHLNLDWQQQDDGVEISDEHIVRISPLSEHFARWHRTEEDAEDEMLSEGEQEARKCKPKKEKKTEPRKENPFLKKKEEKKTTPTKEKKKIVTISLRNFAHSDFEKMATEELNFFSQNMAEQEKKIHSGIGIRALFKEINDVAEQYSRPGWKTQRIEAQTATLKKLTGQSRSANQCHGDLSYRL